MGSSQAHSEDLQNIETALPGGSVMDEQKVMPSSLPEKRYLCSRIRDTVNTLTICPVTGYVFYPFSAGGGALLANENKLWRRGDAQLNK